MLRKIAILSVLPFYALAAGNGSGEYDIVPRAVNFVLFAAILYYFIATPLKNFYHGRIAKIASKMNEIQEKLIASKNQKLEMMKKLDHAKQEASNAIILAKKEAEIITNKIEEETKLEISVLEKAYEEHKDYEMRKMEKEVVKAVLDEIFEDQNLQLQQKEILNIMMKKVS
ncbi:F0F1 ATP synthase subunit B [Campylobacter sp. 2014D-0216]|uniref:F0F1 ATP synthase subunit B n=1 Tax=Campylobacter sp. 2014D-0216 TaxID=1813595 RepID=UPI0018A4FC6B|nr:F0F1 ATP synthase subunit B [Campylobacter sp. 2014D-0216]QOR01369.1 F0F1 ATP synthase subunit B [Campylobacter sp. 2014D-0216]